MGRDDDRGDDPRVPERLWARCRWLRLSVLRDGEQVAAHEAYRRLDVLAIPATEKVERYREWLIERAPAALVDDGLAGLRRIVERYDVGRPAPAPVRRLRLTDDG